MSKAKRRQLKLATFLINELGIAIVPTLNPGDRGPIGVTDWPNLATRDLATVEKWLKDGCPGIGDIDRNNWACVAKFDGVGCLDVDDPAWCTAHGMPALPTDVYTVQTPSGGFHILFIQTD